ncbi:hypothetical protein ACT3R8_16005 [Halomonas sp. AOP42-C2-23]|uniref:hypothetical protein n=1 Tax=unclassified Halomonas TaxID=2609666 RepID=UPI003F9E9CA0
MKISFHFDADDESLGSYYGGPIREALMKAILESRVMDLHSKIFQGDLLLRNMRTDVEKLDANRQVHRFNKDKYIKNIETLLNPDSHIWCTISNETIERLVDNNVWVMCFESISFNDAQKIDEALAQNRFYLGAIQVDETSPVHWAAYSGSIVPYYRIIGKSLNVFWDGISDDSKDEGHLEELKGLGFNNVSFESLNGRFTIFDNYHNYEHARRIAELKADLGDSLASLADQVISRLSDPAPEIGSKLWSALRSFNRAEVNEDYAQLAASCRRVIEYVADRLFPPQDDDVNGRKVGKGQYKNRILAFASRELASNTNIELVAVSVESLATQLDKLSSLSNKGVHAEVFKNEARRCLIKTIVLLDDIISLRSGSLGINL